MSVAAPPLDALPQQNPPGSSGRPLILDECSRDPTVDLCAFDWRVGGPGPLEQAAAQQLRVVSPVAQGVAPALHAPQILQRCGIAPGVQFAQPAAPQLVAHTVQPTQFPQAPLVQHPQNLQVTGLRPCGAAPTTYVPVSQVQVPQPQALVPQQPAQAPQASPKSDPAANMVMALQKRLEEMQARTTPRTGFRNPVSSVQPLALQQPLQAKQVLLAPHQQLVPTVSTLVPMQLQLVPVQQQPAPQPVKLESSLCRLDDPLDADFVSFISGSLEGQPQEKNKGKKRKGPAHVTPERQLKLQDRMQRNRQSAQASRERKKAYLDSLNKQVEDYTSQNLELAQRCQELLKDNESIKTELRGYGWPAMPPAKRTKVCETPVETPFREATTTETGQSLADRESLAALATPCVDGGKPEVTKQRSETPTPAAQC